MSIFKRILKIFIKSAITCYSMTFIIGIVNLIMGIHIGMGYYFMMAGLFTVCLSLGLVLFNSQKVFTKKVKVVSKVKKAPSKKPQVANQRIQRRKIS